MKLSRTYYLNPDVVFLAKDLLGKYLFTMIDGQISGGIITETEAYAGVTDKASHAYNGRRTKRTEIMYAQGGTSYVYLCYGMHALFNVVTNVQDIPHAILIRAIKPTHGEELMLKRCGKLQINSNMCSGPAKLTKALGIKVIHTGLDLCEDIIWIEDRQTNLSLYHIADSPRIGIDYAEEDALLPYRFTLEKS